MRRTMFLAGVLPFVSAFLGGILAFGLVVPSLATAQSTAAQEVRATSFVLVNESGTVLARLGISPVGLGSLAFFFRGSGTTAATFSVPGVTIYDPQGTVVMRAGRCPVGATCPGGLSDFEGVQLSPNGSVGMLPSP